MITKKIKLLEEYKDGEPKIIDSDVDKVFLNFEVINELGFEDKLNEVTRPIVKINYKGKSIYRKFKQGSQFGISNNEIGILKKDINTPRIKKNEVVGVEISLAGFWELLCFYWKNSKQDISFAMRSAVLGLSISLFRGLLVNYVYD